MKLPKRLLTQSALIFAARLFGAGLIFVAQAAIARVWGSEILGEYLLIMATINLVAMVIPLGFNPIGTYFTADYSAKKDGAMLWKFLLRSYGHITVVGLLFAVFGKSVVGLLGVPGEVVSEIWLPVALMAVATAIIFVNSALLVGLRRPIAGFFSEVLFRPILVISSFAIVALFLEGPDVLGSMIWILSLGYLIVAFFQLSMVVSSARSVPHDIPSKPADTKRWWKFAGPWVIIALATEFFFDIDLVLLAGQLDRQELAIFGICARIFSLMSFGVAAVYAVTLPDMFEAEAKNDRAGFHRKIGDANLVASGIALALVIVVAIGGQFLLRIFGSEFVAGTWPLVLMCGALLVRSVFGPATVVLSVHDRPYASLPAVAFGLVSLVLLNLWLVPLFGLMGAAAAALSAITLWSAGLWVTAWKVAGVDVSIMSRLRDRSGTKIQEASLPSV